VVVAAKQQKLHPSICFLLVPRAVCVCVDGFSESLMSARARGAMLRVYHQPHIKQITLHFPLRPSKGHVGFLHVFVSNLGTRPFSVARGDRQVHCGSR
jgi:hypothetical protein